MTDDLRHLFHALAVSTPFSTGERLAAAGVRRPKAFSFPALYAAADGHVGPEGLFTPAGGPGPWILVPAGLRGLGEYADWEQIDDLVAFRLEAPGRWHPVRRDAHLLGEDALEAARFDGRPLHLHSSPLGWLAAGGTGVCIVDWSLNPTAVFCGVPRLTCDAPALETRLRQRVRETWPAPRIETAAPSRRKVA
ncbi:hypothetical protein [Rhodospirillum centenum]|uniref:Uncharacterized protein n=1 Tax=Rhodospirillum centenum (strain ATCC 51521 / SW) TaxID=414684 RepID=B6IMM6_RHOCS|nr:hypothetical protein [Rhodospirillum centenum]ACI98692.1 phage-related hypothetical protein [Rhodospirillum centenum SW]